jgi:hypothetical protein
VGSIGHYIGTDWTWHGNTKNYLDHQNNSKTGAVHYRVLASATKDHVYYAALERVLLGSGQRDVFALVQPYRFRGKGYNRTLIVKDQDETMGPVDAECPAKILDLLTEPLSEYAAQWRAQCRENLRKITERPQVKVGDTLLFEEPLSFYNGRLGVDTFLVASWGKSKRFWAQPENGFPFLCRLTRNVLKMPYVVVEG